MKKYLLLSILFLTSCSQNVVVLERVCNNRNSYQYFQCVEERMHDRQQRLMEEIIMNEIKKQAKEMAKAMNISEEEAEKILINSILENQNLLGSDSFYTKEI